MVCRSITGRLPAGDIMPVATRTCNDGITRPLLCNDAAGSVHVQHKDSCVENLCPFLSFCPTSYRVIISGAMHGDTPCCLGASNNQFNQSQYRFGGTIMQYNGVHTLPQTSSDPPGVFCRWSQNFINLPGWRETMWESPPGQCGFSSGRHRDVIMSVAANYLSTTNIVTWVVSIQFYGGQFTLYTEDRPGGSAPIGVGGIVLPRYSQLALLEPGITWVATNRNALDGIQCAYRLGLPNIRTAMSGWSLASAAITLEAVL